MTVKPLTVEYKDNQLQISIGSNTLACAIMLSDGWPSSFPITNLEQFMKTMVQVLNKENEDGSTYITQMLDQAAYEALDQGEDGFSEEEFTEEEFNKYLKQWLKNDN